VTIPLPSKSFSVSHTNIYLNTSSSKLHLTLRLNPTLFDQSPRTDCKLIRRSLHSTIRYTDIGTTDLHPESSQPSSKPTHSVDHRITNSHRITMASPRFGQSLERLDKPVSTPISSRAPSPATTHPSGVPSSARSHHRQTNSRTSIISVSSTRSSDIEELPASQPAVGDISWVARYQEAAEIPLLDCLRTGFSLALINPALRSTMFGTEEMCLHCILCVAFDDKRSLVFERPFCKPGPGTTCQRCVAGNLACFRAPQETARRSSSALLRDGLKRRPTISYDAWQETCCLIAQNAGVEEVALRRQMDWDNRVFRPRERGAAIQLD